MKDLSELGRYRYCGHGALTGATVCEWQDIEAVLIQFGQTLRRARAEYHAFVAAGVLQGRRPELQGGGLIRSAGGWEAVRKLRRGRESYRGDERVLGSSDFVEAIQRKIEAPKQTDGRPPKVTPQQVIDLVCRAVGASAKELQGGGRRAAVSQARAGVAYLWIEHLGRNGPVLARMVGIHTASIYRVARRGRREAARWEKLLDHL